MRWRRTGTPRGSPSSLRFQTVPAALHTHTSPEYHDEYFGAALSDVSPVPLDGTHDELGWSGQVGWEDHWAPTASAGSGSDDGSELFSHASNLDSAAAMLRAFDAPEKLIQWAEHGRKSVADLASLDEPTLMSVGLQALPARRLLVAASARANAVFAASNEWGVAPLRSPRQPPMPPTAAYPRSRSPPRVAEATNPAPLALDTLFGFQRPSSNPTVPPVLRKRPMVPLLDLSKIVNPSLGIDEKKEAISLAEYRAQGEAAALESSSDEDSSGYPSSSNDSIGLTSLEQIRLASPPPSPLQRGAARSKTFPFASGADGNAAPPAIGKRRHGHPESAQVLHNGSSLVVADLRPGDDHTSLSPVGQKHKQGGNGVSRSLSISLVDPVKCLREPRKRLVFVILAMLHVGLLLVALEAGLTGRSLAPKEVLAAIAVVILGLGASASICCGAWTCISSASDARTVVVDAVPGAGGRIPSKCDQNEVTWASSEIAARPAKEAATSTELQSLVRQDCRDIQAAPKHQDFASSSASPCSRWAGLRRKLGSRGYSKLGEPGSTHDLEVGHWWQPSRRLRGRTNDAGVAGAALSE